VLSGSFDQVGNSGLAVNRFRIANNGAATFSSTVTAPTFIGELDGKLTTARTIALSGDVTGSAIFDGSQDITITATVAPDSVQMGTDTAGDYVESVASGTGISVTGTGESAAVVVSHADTSSQSSVNNSAGTVIQDIAVDQFGHITTIGSVDLDTRYYTETESDNRFVNVAGDTLTGHLTLHADPTQSLHAATKQYVDTVAEGLKPAPAVRVLASTNLDATYDNGASGVGSTLTATSNGEFSTIDDISLVQNDSVLVAAQTNSAHNGRYILTDAGSASTPWVLTRCSVCDESSEISGKYFFVEEGTTYGGSGWVEVVDDPDTFVIGTDAITLVQFSGSGSVLAGAGLERTGTTLSHADTSTQASVTNSNGTVIQSVTLDTYGHVTELASADLSTSFVTLANTQTITGTKTFSNTIVGSVSGSAATLATSRTIALSGDVTGSASFDGSANATIAATVADNSHNHTIANVTGLQTALDAKQDTLVSSTNIKTVNGASLLGSGDITIQSGSEHYSQESAPSNPTVGATWYVPSSATTYIRVNTGTVEIWVDISSTSSTTAESLATARTIALSGDVTGSTSFDGSQNVTITATVADNSHNHTIANVSGLQTALDAKQATLVSGTNIKTVNGISLLGSGSVSIVTAAFTDRSVNEEGHAVFIGTTGTGEQSMYTNSAYRFNSSTGEVSATNFNATSDASKKTNVATISDALATVQQLRGVTFNWISDDRPGIGVIAQELEKLVPEAVVTDAEGYKSVQYGNLVGLLIEAVKELSDRVEQLQQRREE